MKILHITPSFFPASVYGGPMESVRHLCRELARSGDEVRVLTTNANGTGVLDVPVDVDLPLGDESVVVRYCQRVGGHTVSPALVARLISGLQWADVAHLHAVYSFPTIPTLAAARVVGRPLVWSPRGALQRWSGSTRLVVKAVWETTCRMLADRRVTLHATSNAEATACGGRFPLRIVTIPNGVDPPAHLARRVRDDELRLAYLGRLHPIKGLESLIDAAGIVAKRASLKWSLRIAGHGHPGYERQLQDRISALGLAERVRLIGQVEGTDKSSFFEESDVLIAPSHSENFGIVIAEALAHAVPVIASRGTPWPRLEEVGCGLWVANDADHLAEAIIRSSGLDLNAMGERGRAWMLHDYAWSEIASQMRAVYADLADTSIERIA